MKTTAQPSCMAGFTLIEVLVVVVLLGVLATLIVPSFAGHTDNAEQIAFATDVKVFRNAALVYMAKTEAYLEDSPSGQCPAGWEDYIDVDRWTSPTPIGGLWDFELDSFGIKSAFGVHFSGGNGANPGDVYMQKIDAILDDGDLATGVFQKIAADRYYYIIEEL